MNTTNPLFDQFDLYENTLINRYEKHPLFLNIQKLNDKAFLHVLTQYGEGISAHFVMFLETILRQLTYPVAQEAVVRILRDEIPAHGPTHQQMRTTACEKIGITRATLLQTKLTKTTQTTLSAYFGLARECSYANKDLALTVFARVIGESLVGVVYKVFTQEIMRRFLVSEGDIEFYSFHWHHDEKGGAPPDGRDVGHIEYYDTALSSLLTNTDDLKVAKRVALHALKIRMDFQEQFIK